MPEQKAKNISEVASKFASLMDNGSSPVVLNPAIEGAARLMLEAQTHLVAKGLSECDALARVKLNFERGNLSGQRITLEQLCK